MWIIPRNQKYLTLLLRLIAVIVFARLFITVMPSKKPVVSNEKHTFHSGRRSNAAIVSLCRNSELYEMAGSIRQIEDRVNKNFNYPWVFLNDEPFSEEFISMTSALVSGPTEYAIIPHAHWSYPEWVDLQKAKEGRDALEAKRIIYELTYH
ncbi:Alpha-1,2 mannosyltransferase KTR1 [Neolecta irregularis DAH-3]|uniref:Alpha-1,2 mannosyltransferase KTR1 n=1 Tax=Neolecta irregularis (strain DAH-3) TaxID=1198029 RepID=A0A1U7LKR2_NEOID|nr:Alpha-1,2 mannosyltransferase KTR1 [Neolecta irregularis DAH-3]|eukprot:OLL23245.1 Alpha-1,2 mannosyltransferase KTR1 [Neolecta irregularis DAH-3]